TWPPFIQVTRILTHQSHHINSNKDDTWHHVLAPSQKQPLNLLTFLPTPASQLSKMGLSALANQPQSMMADQLAIVEGGTVMCGQAQSRPAQKPVQPFPNLAQGRQGIPRGEGALPGMNPMQLIDFHARQTTSPRFGGL
ncbi:MAG: hypothetical protein ACREXM_20740, partial [Gammaproteobacteria bacterium]